MRPNLYSLLRKYGKDVTIIRRAVTSIDRITGVKTVSNQTWSVVAGFVPYRALPRKDQVVVADAWFIVDFPVYDKDEFHCDGDAYVAVKISNFDDYSVVAATCVAKGETHLAFRSEHVQQANALPS